MRHRLLVAALSGICLAGPALADAGVRPTWTDFQPAVSTQYRPPDGGQAYPKPDTRSLIRPEDRRTRERDEAELNRRAAQPLPNRGADVATPRPPRRMRDPLAIPPASSTSPAMPSSPAPIEAPRP